MVLEEAAAADPPPSPTNRSAVLDTPNGYLGGGKGPPQHLPPYPLEPSTHATGWQEAIISHGQSVGNHRCVFVASQNLTLHERINIVQRLDYCSDTVDFLQRMFFIQSRCSSSFAIP